VFTLRRDKYIFQTIPYVYTTRWLKNEDKREFLVCANRFDL